jgi:hypothetical protein
VDGLHHVLEHGIEEQGIRRVAERKPPPQEDTARSDRPARGLRTARKLGQ